MALPPKFAGQRFLASASENPAQALHTLELYLDYVCPVCCFFSFLLGYVSVWGSVC